MNEVALQIDQARVLVVDDDPANVLLLEKILDRGGYANVQSTTDPCKVKAMHQKWSFDIILLDIRMPELDGFQVMDQLAKITENDYLPILVLTAQIDSKTRLTALEKGAKDFLTKPFDQAEVLLYKQRLWQKEILEAKVRERTQELRASRLEIVGRLARAGEYRDNETGAHVIRMSKFCQRLALAVELGGDRSEMILHASPMHDVGKIGIPDGILLKPGKLDAEEWAVMKTHADIGGAILDGENSDVIRMARSIALTHHEKWDGSGYPAALAGADIPIEGRICALCDVFDALTSERPYKKAWSMEETLALIEDNQARHFDPGLMGPFKEILPDLVQIKESHPDSGSDFKILS
jgi:putative two-component system response regulator